jgi:hypothetical protein
MVFNSKSSNDSDLSRHWLQPVENLEHPVADLEEAGPLFDQYLPSNTI